MQAKEPTSAPAATFDSIERVHVPALLAPLRVRDFRLLWIGESVSLLGDQFYFVALAWLTLQLTGSALALGTVEMTAAIPRGALMLIGGAAADRFSPRMVMLVSSALRGLLVGVISVLVFSRAVHLWQLYLVAGSFGVADALYYPASLAIVPTILREDRVAAGTGLMQGALQSSGLVGPALAGVVIASLGSFTGSGSAFATDAASFACAVLTLWIMQSQAPHPALGGGSAETGAAGVVAMFAAVGAGLRYAWNDPVVRPLLFVIAAVDFSFAGTVGVGLAALAHARFSAGAVGFGAMVSAFGAGALIGTLAGGSIRRPRRRGVITIGVVALLGTGLLLLAAAPNVVVAATILAAIGFGSGLVNVLMVPWIQMRADPRFLGRLMSLIMFASVSLAPLSYALAGAIADLNLALLFLAAGVIVLAAGVVALASHPVRTID